MDNKIILIVVILVLIGGGYYLYQNSASAPANPNPAGTQEEGTEAVNDTPGVDINVNMPVPGSDVVETVVVREFSIDGAAFSFTPNKMEVNRGDTVSITFRNTGGNHDLRIDEFNAGTKVLKSGESETITFVADKSGTFEYYCSVGTHRQQGMVGTLIVR